MEAAATPTDQAWDITTDSAVGTSPSSLRSRHHQRAAPIIDRSSTAKLLPATTSFPMPASANDGDGPDADASDPGDWVDATDRATAFFADCGQLQLLAWHARVEHDRCRRATRAPAWPAQAGARKILPVRVLGKCGGFDSDIIDGMRWAAGSARRRRADQSPHPANIINLSLGGDDDCSAAYQSAVDEITGQGTLIVASVGNDGIPPGTPANCTSVLGVGGIRHVGTKIGFSNLGPGTDISAPGGNCVNNGPPFTDAAPCVYAVQAAIDTGTHDAGGASAIRIR